MGALSVAVLLAMAGCGPSLTRTPPGEAAPGNLMVLARQDAGGQTYFEGSLRYVRIARAGGSARSWQTVDGQETWITVRPGNYEISAWERVCGGNCDDLEPITNRCGTTLEIPADGTARIDISWQVPKPCVMTWAIGIP